MYFEENGWLAGVRRSESPNQDKRPTNTPVGLLVIHNISLPPGEFGTNAIEDLFLNRLDPKTHPAFNGIHQMRVSSHLLIRRDGEVVQFVPLTHRAWHAGQSEWQSKSRCNDFSIGIELEGTDEMDFTESQYQQLARITQMIMAAYPNINPDRIVGHSDISPGRKTDPGPHFNWLKYKSMLATVTSR